MAQDIRRGETVIVFDPKGDVDLLRRMIEPLLVEYDRQWFGHEAPKDWMQSVKTIADNVNEKNLPTALRGRDPRAIALIRYAKENGMFDQVADALRSAFEYDKTYFDKLTASLLPLLEKLSSGRFWTGWG